MARPTKAHWHKLKRLGRYDTAEEAALVYARQYIRLHGQDARPKVTAPTAGMSGDEAITAAAAEGIDPASLRPPSPVQLTAALRISVQKASCEKRRGNGPLAVPEAAAPLSLSGLVGG